jgi:hypothetical protein
MINASLLNFKKEAPRTAISVNRIGFAEEKTNHLSFPLPTMMHCKMEPPELQSTVRMDRSLWSQIASTRPYFLPSPARPDRTSNTWCLLQERRGTESGHHEIAEPVMGRARENPMRLQ